MSEDLNTIREKLLEITHLITEVHEFLIKVETQVDLIEVADAYEAQSPQ